MNEIEIVEYHPVYAKSIADMWNKSSASWGGSNIVKTEESILNEHANTSHLNVFLALDGEDVVGYCSFSHYKEDEGALYIPLLNVRTDYHGKKIGKALVLRAVERTVELGWPRLDLYTWAGNTKAVPTYKKCGFFWEKRDETTHLMNFIPTVLKTEAISHYFSHFHWYNDCIRELEIKPDGKEENGFEYFEYLWIKDDRKLRVEFERTGRGLRLIETDDYLIRASVEEHELVCGRNYKVHYEFINKSGKPLNIKVKGRDDKNIQFSYEESIDVTGKQKLEGIFHAGEIIEEQNAWRTHPVVSADLLINGKHAKFSVGIIPKFPAKVALVAPNGECFKHAETECYLTIENHFKEEALFEFDLPSSEHLTFHRQHFQIRLQGKAKSTVPVPCTLRQYTLYKSNLRVTASLSSGEKIHFQKRIDGLFKGRTGKYGGETDSSWIAVNGAYSLTLSKFNNEISIHHFDKDDFNTWWMYPKLGLPFSSELSQRRPLRVDIYPEAEAIVLVAVYESSDFKQIELTSKVKLYPDGIVERNFEVLNRAEQQFEQEIRLHESFYHNLYKGILPYDGKFIQLNDSYGDNFDYWETDKITENWMFSRGSQFTRGICWPSGSLLMKDEWHLCIEHHLGKIPAGEKRSTKSTYIAFGTFRDWHSFRNYALSRTDRKPHVAAEHFEFSVNRGNPFVQMNFPLTVKDHKKAYFDGKMTLSAQHRSFEPLSKAFNKEDQVKEASFDMALDKKPDIELVTLDVHFDALEFQRKSVLFPIAAEKVRESRTSQHGMEIFTLDNGALSIKACPAFANSLFSLVYKGQEWLDSSFPEPHPKSWWNPWFGGIVTQAQEISFYSILAEERSTSFVALQDQKGNEWSGIRVRVNISKNKKYRGLELNHYYLLLPGAPVLCYTTEIVQNTGTMYNSFSTNTWSYFKPDSDIKNSWFQMTHPSGETIKYNAGRVGYRLKSESPLLFGSNRRQDKLLVVTNTDNAYMEAFANNEITAALIVDRQSAPNEARFFTQPVFYCFTGEYFPYSQLHDLLNIQFKTAGGTE